MGTISDDIAVIQRISAVPTILDVVCRTTGMGFAAVARVTEEHWIACSVLDNIHFGLQPGDELRAEATICHEIRKTGKPVAVDHAAKDPVYATHPVPQQYGFQSYVSVPIILPNGEMFGTLCAIDANPARVSTPEVLGMFTLFAELIAFHIDAEERLAQSASLLLSERDLAKMREQFIGVLGHDLRTPLGALAMGAQSLQEGGTLGAEDAGIVAMMLRSVARMSNLIEDSLDLTRGQLGGGVTLETQSELSVEPVLRQALAEMRIVWPGRAIEARFDLQERIDYDRRRMAQLFTNLLSNAMIYGHADQPVRVVAQSRDGKFELSIANAADPIPPERLQRLFEPFQRGDTEIYRKGLGLGLYIASAIAKSHGGQLTATSDEKETRFTFSMPSIASTSLASKTKSPRLQK